MMTSALSNPAAFSAKVTHNGNSYLLRLLTSADAELFGSYLEGLGEESHMFFGPHPLTREAAVVVCANLDPQTVMRFGLFCADSTMIGYFLLFPGVRNGEKKRYAEAGITLSGKTDCTFAPSLADTAQSKGLGSSVFGKIAHIAAKLGFGRMVLSGGVQERNPRGVAFYTKNGFSKIGEFSSKTKDGTHINNHDMICTLPKLKRGINMTIEALNDQFGIESKAVFDAGRGDLPRLTLTAPDGACELYLHGAHVTGYTPKDELPVIWMSDRSEFRDSKPIRGGIPICFPWFGIHGTDSSLPSHGLVRLVEWAVESVEESGNEVTATLSYSSTLDTQSRWPGEFRAVATIVVSDSLSVSLAVKNTGTSKYTFTEALHSYFAVSDIRFVSVEGMDGVSYIDRLLEQDEPLIQRGSIQFTSETDRPYLDTDATCVVDDPGNERQIVIEKSGSATTVVWNPWINKARRMEDFGDDEWMGMVCVETANALHNAVTLSPGETHTISASIAVRHE